MGAAAQEQHTRIIAREIKPARQAVVARQKLMRQHRLFRRVTRKTMFQTAAAAQEKHTPISVSAMNNAHQAAVLARQYLTIRIQAIVPAGREARLITVAATQGLHTPTGARKIKPAPQAVVKILLFARRWKVIRYRHIQSVTPKTRRQVMVAVAQEPHTPINAVVMKNARQAVALVARLNLTIHIQAIVLAGHRVRLLMAAVARG